MRLLMACTGHASYCLSRSTKFHWHLYPFWWFAREVVYFPVATREGLEVVRLFLERRASIAPEPEIEYGIVDEGAAELSARVFAVDWDALWQARPQCLA